MAYGASVSRAAPRGSVLDVAPTVLYYFGLPIGRDMDGYARTDLFTPRSAATPIASSPPTSDRRIVGLKGSRVVVSQVIDRVQGSES